LLFLYDYVISLNGGKMKTKTKKKLRLSKKTIANLRPVELLTVKAGGKKDTLGTGTFVSCFVCTEHDCESSPGTCQDVKCEKPG
jgi:hypothetical protein